MDREKIRTLLAYLYLAAVVIIAIWMLAASRG